MACSKWEEIGLLYCSNELDAKDAGEFEEHLKSCDECRQEKEAYIHEREMFFTADILGEVPSTAIDDEIRRVCKDGKKRYTSVGFFPMIFKKGVFSATFFALGFVVVSYFVYNAQKTGSAGSAVSGIEVKKTDSLLPESPEKVAAAARSTPSDSNSDSVIFPKTQGTLDMKGVVPVVDTKDK